MRSLTEPRSGMIASFKATTCYLIARWFLADMAYIRKRHGPKAVTWALWHGIPKRKHWWRTP